VIVVENEATFEVRGRTFSELRNSAARVLKSLFDEEVPGPSLTWKYVLHMRPGIQTMQSDVPVDWVAEVRAVLS